MCLLQGTCKSLRTTFDVGSCFPSYVRLSLLFSHYVYHEMTPRPPVSASCLSTGVLELWQVTPHLLFWASELRIMASILPIEAASQPT